MKKTDLDEIQAAVTKIRLLDERIRVAPLDYMTIQERDGLRSDVALMLSLASVFEHAPVGLFEIKTASPTPPYGMWQNLKEVLQGCATTLESVLVDLVPNPPHFSGGFDQETRHRALYRVSDALSALKLAAKEEGALCMLLSPQVGEAPQLVREIIELKKQAEEAAKIAKEAAGARGVATFSKGFRALSKSYGREFGVWTKISLGLFVITIVALLASVVLLPISTCASQNELVQVYSTRITVIILLVSATIWCANLAKAAKHHSAVNLHRSMALDTFKAFMASDCDGSTKDYVLRATTDCIFAQVPTGYLQKDAGATELSSKALDAVKTISQASKIR